MAFPGTISLRPTTLIAVLRDYVLSLAAHGFQRFYFVNGHGGNVPSLQAAFSDIHAEAQAGSAPLTNPVTDLQCTWVDWWKQPAVVKRQKEFFGEEDGIHATAGEISLSQYLYPEAAAKARPLEPVLAPTGPIHGAKDFRRRFPDGRIASNPSLASPERGEILFGIAVEAISAAFLEFARA
jgi:creatinine amidohydrolase